MNIFICKTCGHVEFNNKPEQCPVCASPGANYEQNDNIFTESMEKTMSRSMI